VSEVCSTITYISYDEVDDTKQTVDEVRTHNEVLFTVYHCPLPRAVTSVTEPLPKGTP
jgi:hypothetical protein